MATTATILALRQMLDGGPDPWLPERLRRNLAIRHAEKTVHAGFAALIGRWLDTVRRSVFAHGVLDTQAVYRDAPALQHALATLVEVEVREVFEHAFTHEAGGDALPDAMATVQAYLAQAKNRLVGVPDTVYNLVREQVSHATDEGWDMDQLAAKVEHVLSANDQQLWANRGMVVARTEAISAYNAGTFAGMQSQARQTGGAWEKQWLATEDAHTRPTHREADGQRVELGAPFIVGGAFGMFPGDPSLPPQEVIQCVLGGAAIEASGVRRAYRFRYSGQLVTIRTKGGAVTSVSPYHPVLTKRGWVPACEIDQADYLVRRARPWQLPGTQPDVQADPSTAREIFDALAQARQAQRVGAGSVNFHGDRPYGDVDVVSTDRVLGVGVDTALLEKFDQFCLACADAPNAAASPSFGVSLGLGHAERGSMCWSDLRRALLSRHPRPLERLGVALSTRSDSPADQAPVDSAAAGAETLREGVDGLAGLVALDEVIGIDHDSEHDGHLYSFETNTGIYVADGIVSHNCRCSLVMVRPGERVSMTNRQYKGQL